MVRILNLQLYNKLKIIPVVLIIVSVFIIGINFVRGYDKAYINPAYNNSENSSNSSNDKVLADFVMDLNTASFEELKKLQGVGDAIARRILEFRIDTGGFKSVDELLLLEGVSESKFKDILPYVTVIDPRR